MDLDERFSLLALSRILLGYPRISNQLLQAAGSARDAFAGDRTRFRDLFGDLQEKFIQFAHFDAWREIEREFKKLSADGIMAIAAGDPEYPSMLKTIFDPPVVLYAKGCGVSLLNAPSIGIVGARKASEFARRLAATIAEDLSDMGFCVVSGMAYGVDSAAHRGALHGSGNTIAVFGCGVDMIYPPDHTRLADAIAGDGLCISEFPMGTLPFKSNFPQRNRIISGLSLAVLVVEAAERSGSLITARLAAEQGRDVLAVPGAGGSVMARGSNSLIRDGAMLVESAEDVAPLLENEMRKWPALKRPGHFQGDMCKGSQILTTFPKRGIVPIDQIISRARRPAADVLKELTELTLAGVIEELPGRNFRLRRK